MHYTFSWSPLYVLNSNLHLLSCPLVLDRLHGKVSHLSNPLFSDPNCEFHFPFLTMK